MAWCGSAESYSQFMFGFKEIAKLFSTMAVTFYTSTRDICFLLSLPASDVPFKFYLF
jgi:hypothetical protein